MKTKRLKDYILLYLAFLLFSATSIVNKLASRYGFFSLSFFVFYGSGLLILLIYAVLWQKILVRFDLSVAYANRASVTLMGMLWGVLIFQEKISWNMVFGAVIIIAGILIVVTKDDK